MIFHHIKAANPASSSDCIKFSKLMELSRLQSNLL